jgi:hypothetical protein
MFRQSGGMSYAHIEEVQEVAASGANSYLKKGWELLSVTATKFKIDEDKDGNAVYSEKAICVMGKVKATSQLSGAVI